MDMTDKILGYTRYLDAIGKRYHAETFDEPRAIRTIARGHRVLPVCLTCYEQHTPEITCEEANYMSSLPPN